MINENELQQVIYNVLLMQIRFGAYRYGARLPTLEEASQLFLVSIDTVRAAYLSLKQEGYISLSRSVGASVRVLYTSEEIEQHIQAFYALRKDGLIDVSRSMRPLFSHAQCIGFQNASSETLDKIQALSSDSRLLPSHAMIRILQHIYGSLDNDLLMRLVWRIFMFFQAPFLSIDQNIKHFEEEANPLFNMIRLCRNKEWERLRIAVEDFQEQLSTALIGFCDKRIMMSPAGKQIEFHWYSYEKASQLRYSLGMEILISVNRGLYPAGSFLPSLDKLSKEKHVSVSTVRRTLNLLNSIGVTKSINGLGTRILSQEEIADNCDLTQPVARRRLLDCAQGLQAIALSCKDVAELTAASLDSEAICQFWQHLDLLKQTDRYELTAFSILKFFIHHAPFHAVRTAYAELFQKLMWGHPLRGMRTDADDLKSFYLPYLDFFAGCAKRSDFTGFPDKLEELILFEFKSMLEKLDVLGIPEASSLLF